METQLKDQIENLLRAWQAGEIDAMELHRTAEGIWEDCGPWEDYPESDPRSIVAEVLSELEVLNHQWIIAEDIPMFLEFLDTPAGEEEVSWQKWKRYWDEMDMEARRKKVEGNIFYTA